MSVTIVNGDSVQAGVSSNGLIVEVAVSQSNGSVSVVGGSGNVGPVQVSGPSPGGPPVSVSSGAQSTNAVQVQLSPGIGPSIVVNGTSTSIVGTAGINPFIAGDNITITTTGGGITVIGRDPPVYSVNGKSGTVVLSAADVTAAEAYHTHTISEVSGFSAAVASFSPVQSVAGRTGVVSLTTTDVSGFTSAVRTFSRVQSVSGKTGVVSLTTTDVSGFTAAVQAFSRVLSVQGKTSDVVLSVLDITAAAATHTHAMSDIAGLSPSVLLPPQDGQSGKYLKSVDGTAAWSVIPIGGGGGGGGSGGVFVHWYGSSPTLSLQALGGTGASLAVAGYQRNTFSGSFYGFFQITGVSVLDGGSGYTDHSQVNILLGANDVMANYSSIDMRVRTIHDPPTGPWTLTRPDETPVEDVSVSLTLERVSEYPFNYPSDTLWKATSVSVLAGGSGYQVGNTFYASNGSTLTDGPAPDDWYKTWLTVTSVGQQGQVTGLSIGGPGPFWNGGRHRGTNTGVISHVVDDAVIGWGGAAFFSLAAFFKNSGILLDQGSGKYRAFVVPDYLTVDVLLPPEAAPGTELHLLNASPQWGGSTISVDDLHYLNPGQWVLLVYTPDMWWVSFGKGLA